jgi:hypothetical protein
MALSSSLLCAGQDVGGSVQSTTAVIAYAARFLPRLPMQRTHTVLLKASQASGRTTMDGFHARLQA